MIPASQKKTVGIWSAISVVGLLMILLPVLGLFPKGPDAAPMIWIGILIFISGGIVALLLRSRAQLIASIMNPDHILVKWDADGKDLQSTIISRQGFISGAVVYPFKSRVRGGLIKLRVTQPVSGSHGKIWLLIRDVLRKASPDVEVVIYFPARLAVDVNKAADQLVALYVLKKKSKLP